MEAFRKIMTNKFLFFILFITQVLFLFLVSNVFMYHALKIDGYMQGSMEGLESMTDEDYESYNIPKIVFENYDKTINEAFKFFLFVYLCYAFINGVNWNLSNTIVKKDNKMVHYLGKFGVLTLIFILPAMIIIRLISSALISLDAANAVLAVGLTILAISLYFMYISFAIIDRYEFKELKKLLKETYKIGTKKFDKIIKTYIIILIPVAITFYLIYYTLEMNFYLLFSMIGLFVLTINWGRIYFLTKIEWMKNNT